RDTLLMAAALRALGAGVAEEETGDGHGAAHTWRVTPLPRDGRQQDWAEPAHVDAGNAGTVLRFVPPVATLAVRDAAFGGDPRAPPIPPAPHIAMTAAMRRDAGVTVEPIGEAGWRVHPGPVRPPNVDVEPDLSNAAPFLAAALVTGGSVTVASWPARTAQPGDALRELLARMGGNCELTADGLTVRGGATIHGITANLRAVRP